MNPQLLAYDAVSWDENLPRSPIREVSSHFEHLENRSYGLDVTWQPVRNASVNSHSHVGLVTWQWDAVDWACVTVAFTLTKREDQQICMNAPVHSTTLVQVLFCIETSHHLGLSTSLQPRFGSPRILPITRSSRLCCYLPHWSCRSWFAVCWKLDAVRLE